MKKELLYFAAGAVMTGAVFYASQNKDMPLDCDVIATAVAKGTDWGLTRKEKVAVARIEGNMRDKRVYPAPTGPGFGFDSKYSKRRKEAYKACLRAYPL